MQGENQVCHRKVWTSCSVSQDLIILAGNKKERKEKKQENFRYDKVLYIWGNIQGIA